MNHINHETKLGKGFLSYDTSASRTDRGGLCCQPCAGDPAGSLRAGQTPPRATRCPLTGSRGHVCRPIPLPTAAMPAGQGRPRGWSASTPARATPRQRLHQRNCREQTLNRASGTKHGRQAEEGGESSGHGPAQRGGRGPPHLPGGCQPHPARSSGPSRGSQPPEHGLGKTLGALPCTSLPACLPGEPHDHGCCDRQQPAEGQPRPASSRKATLQSTVTARCASRSLEKPPSQCMAFTSSDSEPQLKSPLPGIPQHRSHSRSSRQRRELGKALTEFCGCSRRRPGKTCGTQSLTAG